MVPASSLYFPLLPALAADILFPQYLSEEVIKTVVVPVCENTG